MSSPGWRLRDYFRGQWRRLTLAALAMCGRAGVMVILPWPLKYIINCVILGDAPPAWFRSVMPDAMQSRLGILNLLGGAMVALAVADALLDYLGSRLFLEAGQRSVFALRRGLFAHLTGLSMAFYSKRRGGELMSRLTEDVARIQDIIVISGTGILPHLLSLLGIMGVMLVIDWRYAMIVLAALPALAFFSRRWARALRARLRAARSRDGELWSVAQEVLTALPLVQSSGQERRERRRFAQKGLQGLREVLLASRIQARIAPQVNLTIGIGTGLVTWYGARHVLDGSLTPGDLLLFLAYLRSLVTPVRQIAKSVPILGRSAVALERLRDIFAQQAAIADPPDAVAPDGCRGRLEFRHVDFSHTQGNPTLTGISFALEPGRTVAIVGPTGAGKSTIAALAVRFADPDAGQVLLDGRDLRMLPLSFVRRCVTLLLQDAPLLHGAVWENIAYGRAGATRDDAIRAAIVAGVDDVLGQLPNGYDQPVAERGVALSGGQRQCIAIARATLADAPVLILDEPTSSLDAGTEQRIAAAQARLSAGRATVVIAHRLATVRDADEILVLENGTVVQRGTHRSLLRQDGLYARLSRAQAPAPEPLTPAAE